MTPRIEPTRWRIDPPKSGLWDSPLPIVILAFLCTGAYIGACIHWEQETHHEILVTVVDKEIIGHRVSSTYFLVCEIKDYYRVKSLQDFNSFEIGQRYIITVNYNDEIKSWRAYP